MGRFVTPDEFWKDSHPTDPQSWNEYTYVRNNPLRYIDPTGEGSISGSCYANGTDCGTKTPGMDQPQDSKQPQGQKLTAAQRQALILIIAAIRGHHGVPQALIKLLPKGSEIRAALEKWTTGELEGNHYYNAAHRLYNKAVETLTRLRDPEVQEDLIKDGVRGARKLGQDVLDSDNPAIKNFLDNELRTSSGMTGRQALEKALTGDIEAAAELAPEVVVQGAKIIVEDVPIE